MEIFMLNKHLNNLTYNFIISVLFRLHPKSSMINLFCYVPTYSCLLRFVHLLQYQNTKHWEWQGPTSFQCFSAGVLTNFGLCGLGVSKNWLFHDPSLLFATNIIFEEKPISNISVQQPR